MAQVTLYIDDKLLKTVKKMAAKSKKSVSAWICERLHQESGIAWPEGFFDLSGALAEFERTEPDRVTPRESV